MPHATVSNPDRTAALLQTRLRSGEVAIGRPLSSTLLTLCIAAMTAAAGCFIALGHYARKESVSGYLEPAAGVVRVFAPRSGVISALAIDDGDSVGPGTLLFKVATPQTLADGSDANRQRLTDIGTRRSELQAVRRRAAQRAAAEAQRLDAQLTALHEQHAALRSLANLQTEAVRLGDRQLAALDTLHRRGALPVLQWLSARAAHLAAREKLQSTRERLASIDAELAALTTARTTLQFDTANRLAEADAALLALHETEIDTAAAADFAVRAPVGGRIASLQRHVGETATPAQPVLTIIPESSPLVARLLIPTRAIGFVAPGQAIRLRYDAFPYQHFGTHAGQLRSVASSVLFHGDSFGPLPIVQPAYPATATLAAQAVDANGRTLPLQSGMLLQADILLEQRSILAWLVEPLLGLRGRTQ
jgi:membrane fusion protein